MYRSSLHHILLKTLNNTTWTRSTKDEDNFRQVICSALYEYISPNNVEIPSTRSAHGDIKIFGRKIEVKYASNEKTEELKDVIEDFNLLLESKIEFSIVSIKLDTSHEDSCLHRCIHMPMLPKKGALQTFGDTGVVPNIYKQISIFIAATYPHAPVPVSFRTGKGKNATTYLSFEVSSAIARSSFLETPKGLIHVDVIGSKEDGLISFLFKRANDITLIDIPDSTVNIEIPYDPQPIVIGKSRLVTSNANSRKKCGDVCVNSLEIDKAVPCIKIYS